MRAPRYYGDAEAFLREWAGFAREHPQLGLHVGRSFERCVEDLLRADDATDLRFRDLHREIEELETEIERLSRK